MERNVVPGEAAEWVGGIVSLPTYVNADDAPFRPEAVLWIIPGGVLLGMDTGRPGEALRRAAESFQKAVAAPLFGPAGAPTRIRVSSRELADEIRAVAGSATITCAPTPEIQRFAKAMRQKLAARDFETPSYLSAAKTPKAVAGFFGAAAALFRAAPWTVVPDDTKLLTVTIPELGVDHGAVSIIGQSGSRFGMILFSSMKDFEACLDGAEAFGRGEEPEMPAHLALNFEGRGDLRIELQNEIVANGWEVAGPSATPWLVSVDKDLIARTATASELAIMETLALTLSKLLEERTALVEAWTSGTPFSRQLRVDTTRGAFDVALSA